MAYGDERHSHRGHKVEDVRLALARLVARRSGAQLAPAVLRGFGHVGFLCDDLDKACEFLEKEGCAFKKKPQDGNMKTLAFVYDPDGYWVELIQRKGIKM